jgi:NAD(P)H-hydrate epimerase
VDALLGTGLSRDVEGSLFSLIKRVNMRSNTAHRVLAIDIPSGLDADLGVPLGIAIRAERTITFAAMKPGLVAVNSNAWTGPVIVGDIGVPRELIAELASRK